MPGEYKYVRIWLQNLAELLCFDQSMVASVLAYRGQLLVDHDKHRLAVRECVLTPRAILADPDVVIIVVTHVGIYRRQLVLGHDIFVFLIISLCPRIGNISGNDDCLRFISERLDVIQRFSQMVGLTGNARSDM